LIWASLTRVTPCKTSPNPSKSNEILRRTPRCIATYAQAARLWKYYGVIMFHFFVGAHMGDVGVMAIYERLTRSVVVVCLCVGCVGPSGDAWRIRMSIHLNV
jgi:hypothetical protein